LNTWEEMDHWSLWKGKRFVLSRGKRKWKNIDKNKTSIHFRPPRVWLAGMLVEKEAWIEEGQS